MLPHVPKSLLLVTIFVATSLLTYLSFHGRPLLHSSPQLPANGRNRPASKSGLFSLMSTEDQWDAHWEDLNNSSHDALAPSPPNTSNDIDNYAPKTSKILQAVMLAGDLETTLFERMLATHEAHSKRWGYKTGLLRHFIRGHGDWYESIFSKPLYILQLLTTEIGKAEEERAEWIM